MSVVVKSLHIIYASTSGHTEYAIDVLIEHLFKKEKRLLVSKQRAEESEAEDLFTGDVLLLVSSSWNTGGIEGQLNPHMFYFLNKRAKDVDLEGRKVLVMGAGDQRYRYRCQAADKLLEYIKEHNGKALKPVFRLINEPYGQEKDIQRWGDALLKTLSTLKV